MFRKHLCIVFPLFSINLYESIQANNYEGFGMGIIKNYARQLLKALRFMRNNHIIHCDLKPENILLKSKKDDPEKGEIVIIDLGSSCFYQQRLYTYIQSRFYRAPEIILGIPYTSGIDMWSFGCILIELMVGFPIFPGESEKEHFSLIMKYRGVQPIDVLEQSTRGDLFFDEDLKPIPVKTSQNEDLEPNTKSIAQFLETDDILFLKFVDQCLHWDPELRLTPDEALNHPWLKGAKPIPPTPDIDTELEDKIKKLFEDRSHTKSPASVT